MVTSPRRRGQKRRAAVARGGDQRRQRVGQQTQQHRAAHHPQVAFRVGDDFGAVQVEKGDQRRGAQQENRAQQQPDERGHLDGRLGIARRLVLLSRAHGVPHADLSAYPGQRVQAHAQPQKHSRRAHGGHRVRAQPADPQHVRQVVRHLNQAGSHQRQRQPCQRGGNAALQQINPFFHPVSPFPFAFKKKRQRRVLFRIPRRVCRGSKTILSFQWYECKKTGKFCRANRSSA